MYSIVHKSKLFLKGQSTGTPPLARAAYAEDLL